MRKLHIPVFLRPTFVIVAVFCLFELGARVAADVPPRIGPEYSSLFKLFAADLRKPFFKRRTEPGGSVMVPARSVNVFRETAFEARKPAGRFRVICVGESTVALGDFTRVLSAYLKSALPGVDVEVINAGQGFINPRHVARVFHEALEYEPDVLVVYMGHNFRHEIPDLGPWTLELLERAGRSRVVAWAVHGVRSWTGRRSAPAPDESSRRAAFERSLLDMAHEARARSVPLVVCTAASNLMLPPHFSPDRLTQEALRRLGGAMLELESGRWSRARPLFAALAEDERDLALAHYFLGVAELGLGDRRAARRSLGRARDLDGDDRAPDALNEAVRRLSAGEKLYYVADAEREFAAASDGIPGFPEFIDQCHPRPSRYLLIARPLARAMERAGLSAGRWRRLRLGQEASAVAAVAPDDSSEQRAFASLNSAFISALHATYYGERVFSEIPTRYLEDAFRVDEPAALRRLRSPQGAQVLSHVLSAAALDRPLIERTRALAFVHAGAALRRMGKVAEARRLWRDALPALEGRFAAQLRLQEALAARREGRPSDVRAALELARAASAEIEKEPLYLALRAEP